MSKIEVINEKNFVSKKIDDLKCPICGEPTRVYMGNARKDKLCAKHANMLKNGDIVINDEGLFIEKTTNKVLNKDYKKEEQAKENKEYKVVKCIACGRETKPGFFFCPSCFAKYNNKELLVKIKNCKEIEILDESYEGHYMCDDGHIVKSKSERDIDNYLFENGIPHAYERSFIPESDPTVTLKPDFILPNYNNSGKDVIIEQILLNPYLFNSFINACFFSKFLYKYSDPLILR